MYTTDTPANALQHPGMSEALHPDVQSKIHDFPRTTRQLRPRPHFPDTGPPSGPPGHLRLLSARSLLTPSDEVRAGEPPLRDPAYPRHVLPGVRIPENERRTDAVERQVDGGAKFPSELFARRPSEQFSAKKRRELLYFTAPWKGSYTCRDTPSPWWCRRWKLTAWRRSE